MRDQKEKIIIVENSEGFRATKFIEKIDMEVMGGGINETEALKDLLYWIEEEIKAFEKKTYKEEYSKYFKSYASLILNNWNVKISEENFIETIRENHGFITGAVKDTLKWFNYIGVKM